MSDIVISVQNISKKFELGTRANSFSVRDLVRNSFNKTIHEKKDTTFWALDDVNFNIQKGEAVGIVGKNGAGKSTLLKILSRITPPTSGKITINGRVASLLEVGTGFHPELSGRENIYLNGTILGMRREEISRQFDEIVAFSGVEKFIDTPVKNYSSGMYVRLAFAVAAHLQSEILFIDEVLAVGDLEFQKKCLGKMDEVTKNQGRTILFVSHQITSISRLCKSGIYMKKGQIYSQGSIEGIIDTYISDNENETVGKVLNPKIDITDIAFSTSSTDASNIAYTFEPLSITLKGFSTQNFKNVAISVCFNNTHDVRTTTLWTKSLELELDIKEGQFSCQMDIEQLLLTPGTYSLIINIDSFGTSLASIENMKRFYVSFKSYQDYNEPINMGQGVFLQPFHFQLHQ